MNFYEWLGELGPVNIDFPEDEFQGWWMVEGRPVPEWDNKIVATLHGDDPATFDFGLTENSWPVCSSKMRDFLATVVPGLVQYLPFRLHIERDQSELTRFSVCQFLKLVDCLDRKRTRVRDNWQPINAFGDFATYRPFVLRRDLIEENKLFRINGKCRSIVVREDLKEAIENAGFTGQRFDLVDVS